jgi:CheY-like chemotaxis protein
MISTVLVVDDEPDIRLTARFMLEAAGHNVIEAATGAEALARLQTDRPDLVLLDIRLPDTEGWDIMRNLRSTQELSSVPVLIMSAHSSGDVRERAKHEGSSGYLVKPFREEDLLHAANALLEAR